MFKRWFMLLLLFVAAAAWSAIPAAADDWYDDDDDSVYYLALGTSLAAGIQADRRTCQDVLSPVSYPKFLEWKIKKRVRNVELVNLGCPGETSDTFLYGGGNCEYGTGSQLNEALAFLEYHKKDTVIITIDMGANDVLPCLQKPSAEQIATCVNAAIFGDDELEIAGLTHNLTFALSSIMGSAPSVPIIGMNYYNPTLVTWSPVDDSLAKFLAFQQAILNGALAGVYEAFGIKVADVADAFKSNVFDDFNENGLPDNLDRICAWTWMCKCISIRPEGNIHANWIGYWKIADTFEDQLPDFPGYRPPWWYYKFWD